MQLRDVDLRSVGHSSQKLWPVMDFLNFALCKSFVYVRGSRLQFHRKWWFLAETPFLTIDQGAKCCTKKWCTFQNSNIDAIWTGLIHNNTAYWSQRIIVLLTFPQYTSPFNAFSMVGLMKLRSGSIPPDQLANPHLPICTTHKTLFSSPCASEKLE